MHVEAMPACRSVSPAAQQKSTHQHSMHSQHEACSHTVKPTHLSVYFPWACFNCFKELSQNLIDDLDVFAVGLFRLPLHLENCELKLTKIVLCESMLHVIEVTVDAPVSITGIAASSSYLLHISEQFICADITVSSHRFLPFPCSGTESSGGSSFTLGGRGLLGEGLGPAEVSAGSVQGRRETNNCKDWNQTWISDDLRATSFTDHLDL